MSQGRPTRFAAFGVALEYPEPRERFLDHDVFDTCRRCGWIWAQAKLQREPVTSLLVCPPDYDEPSVKDVIARENHNAKLHRFDRLGVNLEKLPRHYGQ